MKYILKVLFISIVLLFVFQTNAQNPDENEVVIIKGEKFILHEVQTGQTIFWLTRKYKVDQAELEKYNPSLKEGPRIGDVLKIPYRVGADIQKVNPIEKKEPDGFRSYTVKSRKETAFFIARENGITVEDLYKFNPDIKRIKRGTILRIPFWEDGNKEANKIAGERKTTPDQAIESNYITHRVVSGETLYSLAKRFKLSEIELVRLNPEAANLKTGTVLKIPVEEGINRADSLVEDKNETDEKYFEHIIESGETLWSTTRKYGVSEARLKEINPILNTGFPAGAVIKIPVKESEIELSEARPVNHEAFEKHKVGKGETLYGLSRKFGVSILELKKCNPVLEQRNLVEGESILIPNEPETPAETAGETKPEERPSTQMAPEQYFKVETAVEIPESCRPSNEAFRLENEYNVALFLPLYLEANDTLNREEVLPDTSLLAEGLTAEMRAEITQDTSIETERAVFKKFFGGSENFIQFYEGALLAVEQLQMTGINVKLHVFDTEQRAASIRKYLFSEDFLETDLIIGPIYPEVQVDVANLAAKNRIPIVSPLASQSDQLTRNPYYFQVNPSREYLTRATAEMVAEEYNNSNFIVLKTQEYGGTPEGRLVELVQEKFFNSGFMSDAEGVSFKIYDFQKEGAFGLRRIMSKTKENVVYIPSSDEGKLSIAISNLNNLAGEYSITLIGTHRYPNFQSIQIDHFHNLKLKFLAPYWTDYGMSNTIRFINRFKNEFGTEPNNFGMQGFDVTLYFATALETFGSDFGDCLPYFHMDLVQGNYHFDKFSEFGGYMNQGISVISYTNDYRVIRERVKGQPRLVFTGMEP